ncbi:MAG: c-type cytochrome [Candidatus Eremiobacteraeota bacterium]|nr:c-type cytochrome [Candidatus Eremiobacteraeota bacterium]
MEDDRHSAWRTYVVAAAAFALISAFAATTAWADDGAAIFSAKCAACHTIGKGKTVGPDLKGITSSAPHDWLVKWIASPSAMVKSGDPTATKLVKEYPLTMPDLGLSNADIESVLTYIQQQSGGASASGAAPAAAAPPLPTGDAIHGRELFTGGARFTNGGAPCMSCHSIAGIGALGGGTLGPDLTDAYQKYGGDAGLASFLTGLPTPTMNAVWSKNPLTPQEIADVSAFIKEAPVAQRPLNSIGTLALMAVVVLVILAVILGTYWRNRLVTVRASLVYRANGGGSSMDYTRRLAGRS